MKKHLLFFFIIIFMFSGCSAEQDTDVNYKDMEGYKEYISTVANYEEPYEYFAEEDVLGWYNGEKGKKARTYYYNNVRQVGNFLVTDYKDGICINRYVGKSKKINIPEKIEEKPVIKIGSFLKGKGSNLHVLGAFGGIRCEIKLPSTVKYISSCALYWDSGFSEGLYEEYANVIQKITIDSDNPYYTAKNNDIFSKDKKTLLYVNTYNRDDSYNEYTIPECVETFEPLTFPEEGNPKTLIFGKNIKNINTKIFDPDEICYTPEFKATTVVKGYKGTVAEQWAKENKLTFQSIN